MKTDAKLTCYNFSNKIQNFPKRNFFVNEKKKCHKKNFLVNIFY